MSAESPLKRKEPEVVAEAPVEPVAKPAEETASAIATPVAAKRAKLSPPEPAAVRKQLEYYLSDENLRFDKFFHDKISADSEGWLEVALILSCNKMKTMRATPEDVLAALKESKIEVKEGGAAVRRPGNAALPKLESKPQHQKKSTVHAHDGGVVSVFKNVPAEQNWTKIKEALKATLPPKANLWFISEVTDKQMCFCATAPFENDTEFFDNCTLDVGGTKLKPEICNGDLLQQGLKLLPKHIRERREKETRKRQKERNRPIVVGTQRFLNVGALRGRVKEIMNSRSDGEHLKPDGSDFNLIKALLASHHPRGAEKSKGLKGLKVAPSSQGENRCFYMIKEDGTEEDFSAKKCLDAVELNPPYVPEEPKKEPAAKEAKKEESAVSASAASGAAAADSKEEKSETPAETNAESKDAGAPTEEAK